MKLNIPRYEDGELWWNKEDPGFDIITTDYITEINNVDNVIELIENQMCIDTFEEYDELINQINSLGDAKSHIKIFVSRFKDIRTRFNLVTKGMPRWIKETYEPKFQPLIEELKRLIKHNETFIKNNHDEIINIVNGYKSKITNKMKEARARANKVYYEKCKAKINSVPKQPKKTRVSTKTPEELKEARRLANKKYYELQKGTPDIENKKKEYSSKYYQSKKELIEKIKILEAEINCS
jgi:phage host-nuclease inhibitor protein Gam